MSASLAQDKLASPSGASTLATSEIAKDFFAGPTWSVADPVKRRDSVVGDADGQLETHPSSLNLVQPRIGNGQTRPNDPLLGIGSLRPLRRLGPSRLSRPGNRLITCCRMR